MIELQYEMTYEETIAGPLGSTAGSPLGELLSWKMEYMRMAPHFEVGADRYAWLRENLFVGRGRLAGPRAIAYEIYRVL